MKTYKVPHSSLTVPSVVLGMMRIKDMADQDIDALFRAALDVGVTMIDHADIYGGKPHVCESRFGDAVKLSAAQRAKIIIQSKVGIVTSGPYFDFSKLHILKSVDESLKALKTEYMDVL